jgi:hypothetical protein
MTNHQPFSALQDQGLGVALNEANLLAVDVDEETATAAVWLEVLTLPPQGPEPTDRRRRLCLGGVSRVAVSYRDGRWDDPDAPVLPLRLAQLAEVIGAFGQLPVYGWEFFNRGQAPFVEWRDRLSLDVRLVGHGTQTLDLFQEDGQRNLDVRVWFATLTVTTATGQALGLDQFIAGGRRWWDSMYAGDAPAGGHGIVALRPPTPDQAPPPLPL